MRELSHELVSEYVCVSQVTAMAGWLQREGLQGVG
jgi:hypothetical protein